MAKIAIVKYGNSPQYNSDGDFISDQKVFDSITEWTEVSNEEFQLLQKAISYNGENVLLVFPEPQKEVIKQTIADYLDYARKQAERAAKQQKEYAKRDATRKANKEKRDKAKLEKLAAAQG